MPERLRIRDERKSPGTVDYQQWAKAACNATPASWSTYYTANGSSWPIKSYTNMDDVTGNPPRPDKGKDGFVCNRMELVSSNIDIGTGTDWLVQMKDNTCVSPFNYQQQYRRVSTGLTVGRQFCGFSHSVSPLTGRAVMGQLMDNVELERRLKAVSTDVLSKRGRGSSQSNLYESIAEVDKTLALLASYMDEFRKIYTHIRQNNPRALIGDASALYLMTRYGLMPTVGDIQNTIRALNAKLGLIVETTRSQEIYSESSEYTTSSTDVGTVIINGRVRVSNNITVRGWSLDQYNRTLTDALGLNSKNLLTVAWELQKFSFVYDWIANIGDFIGSIVPLFGVTQFTSGYTIECVQTRQYEVTGFALVSPSTFTLLTAPSGSCTMSVRSKRRIAGLLAPSLIIKPDFKLSKLTRVLDAFTLLWQQMSKFRK